MAINIVDSIQRNLAYRVMEKIDPNTQDTKIKMDNATVEKLGQAAIPAVLAGIYKLSRTGDGCTEITTSNNRKAWLPFIYGDQENNAIEKVASYAGVTYNQAASHMEAIAEEATKIIKESLGKDCTSEKVKTYMNSQRHNILVHLPAALHMGDVLNDESIDDKTNKMEGPVSNLMHKIENILSDGDKKKGIF